MDTVLTPHRSRKPASGNSAFTASETLLREIVDNAAVGLAVAAGDGTILYVNKAFRDGLGYSRNDALRVNLESLFHPDDAPRCRAAMETMRNGDTRTCRSEVRFKRKNGQTVWMLTSLSMVSAGKADIFVLQINDIDARKTAEAALIDSERRWNAALESSGQGVWDHNLQLGDYFYSKTWRLIRGMDPDDPVDGSLEKWIEGVHPDDREHVLDSIQKQESGELQFYAFQYRERRADGGWVWIESRGSSVAWDEEGRPTRIIGTDTDITERKDAEARLAEVSRRLELALEISQIGVFEANDDAGTVVWDDRLLEIYGLEREALSKSGLDWQSMLHPDDAEAALLKVEKAVASNVAFANEFRIIRQDGAVRHIRARAAPYIDKAGGKHVIGANWDVTEDIELRAELERSKIIAEQRNVALEAAKVSIEYNALHDHLTGLPNRRYMDRMLESKAAESAGSGALIAILHIDLDRFKQINDTLGHQAGDFMLQQAAAILKKNMRGNDFVARIGGDEFVVISSVSRMQQDGLAAMAERIIEEFRKPVSYNGQQCRFGASVGIACQNDHEAEPKQLLVNADIALYRAKSLGRNRYEFFSCEMQAQILDTKRVADEILHGIEHNEFIAWYQPQFNARTLDIVGVETLARWNHPSLGILTPDKFLRIAEDLDVVATIDQAILMQALSAQKHWRQIGLPIPKISVNVSARRLHDPAIAESLRDLEIQPGTLSFELLESIFLDDIDPKVAETLQRIRELGIDIEIDDFGTGHASIVGLLKLSPRRLKIDRTLVDPIHKSLEQRKLVGSIIEIGRSLNIEVVAEGVETMVHAALLRDLGCDILQGYAFAKAMPADELTAFVTSQNWRNSPSPAHALQAGLGRAIEKP